MNKFILQEVISKGSSSTIYKARQKNTLKYANVKSVDKSQRDLFMTEVRILNHLANNYPEEKKMAVIRFISWYETTNHLWVICEYCPGDNLQNILQQDKAFPLPEAIAIFYRICCGLMFIHNRGIIHCNLCPRNILFGTSGRILLCNFKRAIILSERRPINKSAYSGSHSARGCYDKRNEIKKEEEGKCFLGFYTAPEIYLNNYKDSFSITSDMWALGAIGVRLVDESSDFQDRSHYPIVTLPTIEEFVASYELQDKQRHADGLNKKSDVSYRSFLEIYHDLIYGRMSTNICSGGLLNSNTRIRGSWKDVKKHPIFELLKTTDSDAYTSYLEWCMETN